MLDLESGPWLYLLTGKHDAGCLLSHCRSDDQGRYHRGPSLGRERRLERGFLEDMRSELRPKEEACSERIHQREGVAMGQTFRRCIQGRAWPVPGSSAGLGVISLAGQQSWTQSSPAWSQIPVHGASLGKVVQSSSVQFSSVAQSCPTLQLCGLWHARLPCPSPTPRAYSNSCP